MAFEYVTSKGQPTRRQVVQGAVLGALPVGIGARGALKAGSKVSKLRYFSPKAGDRLRTIPMGYLHPQSSLYLGKEIVGITSGAAAGYAVGQLYDHFKSSGDQHTSRSRRSPTRTSTRGRSALSSKSKSAQARRRRTKALSAVTRQSRTRTPPYCRRHKKRHWCVYTR